MNRKIVEQLFPGTSAKLDAGLCPTCDKPVGDFRNTLSQREFGISGMCQACQDSVFGRDKDDPPAKVELENKVFIVDKPYQMFSGAAEAARFVYRKVVDSKGDVWLYPSNSETPAEQVHHHNPRDKHSQGYGGSTLNFLLEDGTVYAAAGPWHANADSMFAATGVDIRNTSRTYGCIARKRVYKSKPGSYSGIQEFHGVLHADEKPVIGKFSRIHDLAREWADKLGHPVAYYSESKGGSSSGYAVPTGTDFRQWATWFSEQKEDQR